jgi:hypothetical protein
LTKDYHGFPKMNTPQIGGQKQTGGDILEFIRKFDPGNKSGSVIKALDIMEKLKKAAESGDMDQAIQPLENILGSSLFNAMQAAGAKAKAASKISKETSSDIIMELIAAALEIISDEDKLIVADLLDSNEISLISTAYYGNGIYVSAKVGMPISFVNAINYLIPIFRLKEKQR